MKTKKNTPWNIPLVMGLILFNFCVKNSLGQYEKILLKNGNRAYESGQYQNAISQYDSALQLQGEYTPAWCNKGNAFYRIGEKSSDSLKDNFYQKAAESYESSLLYASQKNQKAAAFRLVWFYRHRGGR